MRAELRLAWAIACHRFPIPPLAELWAVDATSWVQCQRNLAAILRSLRDTAAAALAGS